MLENKAQNSSGKQALRSTKFHALSRVIKEGYLQPSLVDQELVKIKRGEIFEINQPGNRLLYSRSLAM